LTYLPANSPEVENYKVNRSANPLLVNSFLPTSHSVVSTPTPIILSQLNITPRDFILGFQDGSGSSLKDLSGNTLNEYFSLHLDSKLMLNATDTEGDYQLAMITDDGAILMLTPPSGIPQEWINGDGPHSAKLNCARKTISLTKGVPVPIHIDYYQAPQVRLAFMLIWRLNPSPLTDPECEQNRSDNYFFAPSGTDPSAPDYNPAVPRQPYMDLLVRGWSVIPAANYYLVTGTNNCAKK